MLRYVVPGLILSVQSNEFVQSKIQIVFSNTRNCAVQNLLDGYRTNKDGNAKSIRNAWFCRLFSDVDKHMHQSEKKL